MERTISNFVKLGLIVIWIFLIMYTLLMSIALLNLYQSDPALVFGYNGVCLLLIGSFVFTFWKTKSFETVLK